jgi:protein TonB
VIVQFTISATGSVKDLIVVEAKPEGIFDEAAMRAVARWRYNPKVEEGVAVERVGVQTMITFKLESQ